MEKIFFSPEEVAELIGVSRAFVYKLWRYGRGPEQTKIGRRVFVARHALEDWARKVSGTTVISEHFSEVVAPPLALPAPAEEDRSR